MLNKGAYGWLLFAFLSVILMYPGSVSAGLPVQDSPDTPEFSDPECAFYLDRDNDGEGNERFDTNSDTLVPQETPVVGGCEFKLNAPATVTLVFESELLDWNATVEMKQEPDPAIERTLYAGDNEITDVIGSMVMTANFQGETPRSIRPRTLPDNYDHEVQIPLDFRLISIVAITPDGREDRLERSVHSASAAYIQVHNTLASDDDLPEWSRTLGQEWLDEGYPQVSDSILVQAGSGSGGGGGGTNWWLWGTIGMVIVWLLTVVGALLMINQLKAE